MDTQLEAFIATVTQNATSITDLGKKAIRNMPACRELKKKYDNIDDLINEIYARAEPRRILEDWATAFWEERRLRVAFTCRGNAHMDEAFSARARLEEEYPVFYKRLKFKYTDTAIANIIFTVMVKNPWSDCDTIRYSDMRQGLNREESFYTAIREAEAEIIETCKSLKPGRKDVGFSGFGERTSFSTRRDGSVRAPKKKHVAGRIN